MACLEYFKQVGIDPKTANADDVSKSAHSDGIGCLLENLDACKDYCTDIPKNQTACFSCLSSSTQADGNVVVSCASSDPNKPCCPITKFAVDCSECLAKNNRDFTKCLTASESLSSNKLLYYITIIGSILGALLLIVIVIYIYKYFQKRGQLTELKQLEQTKLGGKKENMTKSAAYETLKEIELS